MSGPDVSAERFAAETARRVLGVDAELWDVWPRQGAYDVRLTYADGRNGAMEVTTYAAEGVPQLESLLSRDRFQWPQPAGARWRWRLRPATPRILPWLTQHYADLILICEQHGVTRPDLLDPRLLPDGVYERALDADLIGDSSLPPSQHGVDVLPPILGPVGDADITVVPAELDRILTLDTYAKRIHKVVNAGEAEAHLFLGLDLSAMQLAAADALAFSTALPPPPIRTYGLTHLWLLPRFSRRVLLWHGGGWTQHDPFD